jgi:hypothetical protein
MKPLYKVMLCSCFALSGLGAATSALAENLPREHDRGVFLRLSAGLGTAKSKIDDFVFEGGELGPNELEMSGMSGDINFAIGGVVARNLAVHATLAGWSVTDPDLDFGEISVESDDVTLGLSMFGAGVTYYIMPANIYLSGSLGAAVLTLDVDGDDAESDAGLGIDLTVGKEWWVGSRWGLGAALGANFHNVPSKDFEDQDFSGSSFAARFSATFN